MSKIVKLFWQISCSVWVTSTNTYLLHLDRFTETDSCGNISICMWESQSRALGGFLNRENWLMVTARLRSQELSILFLMLLNIVVLLYCMVLASPLCLCCPICRIWIFILCICVYSFDIVAFITNTKLQTKMKLNSQYTPKYYPIHWLSCPLKNRQRKQIWTVFFSLALLSDSLIGTVTRCSRYRHVGKFSI